mmetsp:Transcript_46364/g.110402  ORF Transcript_46364/g.110402 Transcript_46364/m.110402 type:complete len:793 (+) Transcript_46364:53-2431(+)
MASGSIVQLDETVINRIAAGEVVVRPANALKELLENSLDAGSHKITVAVKAGGLKMLRVEDDGHGIREEDLPLLCERFTTSKLRRYEELSTIQTFGFRGEALASISHVAHVTVTTMTRGATCARFAEYTDGKLRGPPKSCAGTPGTTLVAEDMFYNNPTRRQALGKESIEHSKVLEVVQRYALHNPNVSFVLRKGTNNNAELHTPGSKTGSATSAEVASHLYGHNLKRELFDLELQSEEPSFTCRGLASGPNWTTRFCTFVLFINNRLVECASLRRAVEAVYAPVLPRHQHPWIYLSLELPPSSIDVNVHPTKMEVQFLHEPAISERIQEALAAKLRDRGGCKTFDPKLSLASIPAASVPSQKKASKPTSPVPVADALQGAIVPASAATDMPIVAEWSDSVAAAIPAPKVLQQPPNGSKAGRGSAATAAQARREPTAALDVQRVRTDHSQRSLDSVWRGQAMTQSAEADKEVHARDTQPMEQQEGDEPDGPGLLAFREAQQLTSIHELKQVVQRHASAELAKQMKASVYIGPVNRELALIQCGPVLRLVNLRLCAQEVAYQRLLRSFGLVSSFVLKEPLPLRELLHLGVMDPESGYDSKQHEHVDIGDLVTQLVQLLESKAEMLWEYVSLHISEGKLLAIPNALSHGADGLVLDKLPLFLIQLCVETNWLEEKACFDGMCRLLSEFCVEAVLPTEEEEAEVDLSPEERRARAAEAFSAAAGSGEVEDVAQAAIEAQKKRARTGSARPLQKLRWLHETICQDNHALWPCELERDGSVLDLVSLEQLFKIFERC